MLFQNAFQLDWTAVAAGFIALLSSTLAVYSQIRTKKIESDVASTQQAQAAKHSEIDKVLSGWQKLVENITADNIDLKTRLRESEKHTIRCEHRQMKLLVELARAGVKLDYDKIMDGLEDHDGV